MKLKIWKTFIIASLTLITFSCENVKIDDGIGNGLIGQKLEDWNNFVIKSNTTTKNHNSKFIIPPENKIEAAEPPIPDVNTDEKARNFINSLSNNKISYDIFIPYKVLQTITMVNPTNQQQEESFVKTKYKSLKNKYTQKLHKILKKSFKDVIYESFELGNCSWIAPGKAFNKIAYWQCKDSKLYYHLAGDRKYFKIQKILNWGKLWYIIIF